MPRPSSVRYLLGNAFYGMAVTEWGDPLAPPVVCVHGLTRNGRDFDSLALALSEDFRVICPDLPGRGGSDWLPDGALYQPPSYVQALSHLLAAIGRPVMWVGTSLGGICGMMVAAGHGQPITRMVLNDIGPFIPKPALDRIRGYIGATQDFADVAALERHLRTIHRPFGDLTDAQWHHLAEYSARVLPSGRVALHYDPAIADPIVATEPQDVNLWPLWGMISVPMMVVRGETSDLLDAATYDAMVKSGVQGLVVENAGHAPALMDAPTIAAIKTFLLAR